MYFFNIAHGNIILEDINDYYNTPHINSVPCFETQFGKNNKDHKGEVYEYRINTARKPQASPITNCCFKQLIYKNKVSTSTFEVLMNTRLGHELLMFNTTNNLT